MENGIARTIGKIVPIISNWDGVDTITQISFGDNRLDPDFLISYDVYVTGAIPSATERQSIFEFAEMFETNITEEKDRFLLNDIPVRIEYKNREVVGKHIDAAIDATRGVRNESTYGYYRLIHGKVVFDRSGWIEDVHKKLSKIPSAFWERRSQRLCSSMEHYLSDLTAALYGEDQLYYILSMAAFLETVCSLLFAVNRKFETSPRNLYRAVTQLEIQPPEFSGRFNNLLREDTAVSRVRKREIAQLIARSMLYL